ncbi:hypothetical protein [Flagellimonas myxillae]|uniref:hypothetical protein n=1 Tax=Flagellimonas myxillae TaxID=2942214 RepID=UPI00201ED006|nr:hypothetical protein [Muricauda myxillae]MCL6266570.1 hypothetical protein [Muricauda myxillae]
MGKNTNSLKALGKQGKRKKNFSVKKISSFWIPGSKENDPHFVIEEALLRTWLIQQGFRRTNQFHIYRVHDGNMKKQNRLDVFAHTIDFVESQSSSLKKPLRNKFMSCALRQCEDILVERKGTLLSLPKINIEQ